jgi:hypothetical protein
MKSLARHAVRGFFQHLRFALQTVHRTLKNLQGNTRCTSAMQRAAHLFVWKPFTIKAIGQKHTLGSFIGPVFSHNKLPAPA